MKPVLFPLLALLTAAPLTGYVASDDWACRPVGPCALCINMAEGPAPLSVGVPHREGGWEVSRRLFPSGAVVELCPPPPSGYARR